MSLEVDEAMIQEQELEDAVEEVVPYSLNENHLQLQNEYTFWILIKSKNSGWEPNPVASFSTVQDFWSIYQHLKRPNQLEQGTQINLFVKGIKPEWEDPQNASGGRW